MLHPLSMFARASFIKHVVLGNDFWTCGFLSVVLVNIFDDGVKVTLLLVQQAIEILNCFFILGILQFELFSCRAAITHLVVQVIRKYLLLYVLCMSSRSFCF